LAAAASILLLTLPIGDWVSLVVLPFAALIYELAAGRSWLVRILSTKTMLLLGGASYSVYLLQYPVRSWVRTIFSVGSPRIASLSAPLTPFILVLLSIGIFLFWEEPVRRRLRKWFSRKQTSLRPSTATDGLRRLS